MAGTATDAFNAMLKAFLEELVECCPGPVTTKIRVYLAAYDAVVGTDPAMPAQAFLASIGEHGDMVMSKNDALFETATLPGGVDLKALWAADLTEATRGAVWQYLQLLFLLASATAMPPEMLASIEGLAATYADRISSGELDLSSVMGMLGGLGGMGGMGGFAGLAGLGLPGLPPKE